jgi:hypothetical protein
MKKHYATHVEDTDKLISVAGPILEYKTWYEQYKKLMEEQAQRKYGLYTPTSEGGDDFDPSSFDQAWTVVGKTNEDEDRATIANITGNGNNLVLSNFGFIEGSGYDGEGDYAGYLVTDGVDDKIISSNFVMDKEFTIVGEWKFMDSITTNAGIVKSPSLCVYNRDYGLKIYINNTNEGLILSTNTLKAICSDGRVYSDGWSETLVDKEQPITSSRNNLLIGISGDKFAKIALKNLAIYNRILSKDDCIKAYDYLQTLKAK